MLVVGGMASVTGAVVGCYFFTVVYELFRRWEVNGLAGVKPPSGTANLVLALVLLVTLVLRPKGLTGGREIPWPGDWSLDGLQRACARARASGGRADRRAAGGDAEVRASCATRSGGSPPIFGRSSPTRPPSSGRRNVSPAACILVVGTGTSWHAANHAVWLLREAGVEAWALQAMDAALYGMPRASRDAILVLSHRNTKRFSTEVLERSRGSGDVPVVVIGGIGSPGVDVETVEQERCATFTASHLGALMRVAQLANALGASLPLERVPEAVGVALERELGVEPPARLLELIGAGPNQWTAAEGALKIREASRVATEGLSVEQFFHGPSVALGPATRSSASTEAVPAPSASGRSRARRRRAERACRSSRRRRSASRSRSSR